MLYMGNEKALEFARTLFCTSLKNRSGLFCVNTDSKEELWDLLCAVKGIPSKYGLVYTGNHLTLTKVSNVNGMEYLGNNILQMYCSFEDNHT